MAMAATTTPAITSGATVNSQTKTAARPSANRPPSHLSRQVTQGQATPQDAHSPSALDVGTSPQW